jgi:Mor family transcriptional regulator
MKKIGVLLGWVLGLYSKVKGRWVLARAALILKKSVEEQIVMRKALRLEINKFLMDYFGIDGRSNYIPYGYKNKEEVRVAVLDKFEGRMNNLSLTYSNLFS